MREIKSGIYAITNKTNGKMYIGQSGDLHHRLTAHRSYLRRGAHHNRHLQASWNKYGEDNFEFSVLEECGLEELDSKEQYYIDKFNSMLFGYNRTLGGDGIQGHKMSEESRRRMSDSHCHLYGSDNPNAIGVVLLNTGEKFGSIRDASDKYGVQHADISKNAKRKSHSAGELNGERLVWAYESDYDNMSYDTMANLLEVAQNCKRGKMCHRSRPVMCVDTGEVFYSLRRASQVKGIAESLISATCRGEQKHAGGLSWKYYNKDIATDDESGLLLR